MQNDAISPRERANPKRESRLSRWLEERLLRQEIVATESRLSSYELTAQAMGDAIPEERGRLRQLKDRQHVRGFTTQYKHQDLSKLVTALFLVGTITCIAAIVAFSVWWRQ